MAAMRLDMEVISTYAGGTHPAWFLIIHTNQETLLPHFNFYIKI